MPKTPQKKMTLQQVYEEMLLTYQEASEQEQSDFINNIIAFLDSVFPPTKVELQVAQEDIAVNKMEKLLHIPIFCSFLQNVKIRAGEKPAIHHQHIKDCIELARFAVSEIKG